VTEIQKNMVHRSAARTHVGTVRQRNEDAVLERPEIGLWAVADGVGGHQRGDYASRRIVAALSEVARAEPGFVLVEDVRTCLAQVNSDLRAMAATIGPRAMIGSTVVVLLVFDGSCCCLWAGDSRFYLMRAGELQQLSRDQSYVQGLVDGGEIEADAAAAHPLSHVITNAVGTSAEFVLEERQDRLEPGDILMLCSDGLIHAVADAEIAAILREYPVVRSADRLIERALECGARDNVSAVVIEYAG
jgi:serine/threonine protein phosphatase PrpC